MRQAAEEQAFELYAPGLHHLALAVETRSDVDAAHAAAVDAGATVLHAPRLFPQYHPDYYATFFLDPDGYKSRTDRPLGRLVQQQAVAVARRVRQRDTRVRDPAVLRLLVGTGVVATGSLVDRGEVPGAARLDCCDEDARITLP